MNLPNQAQGDFASDDRWISLTGWPTSFAKANRGVSIYKFAHNYPCKNELLTSSLGKKKEKEKEGKKKMTSNWQQLKPWIKQVKLSHKRKFLKQVCIIGMNIGASNKLALYFQIIHLV